MGKSTRIFRSSKRSLNGDSGAKNYSYSNRSEGAWHVRAFNYFKVKGKAFFK